MFSFITKKINIMSKNKQNSQRSAKHSVLSFWYSLGRNQIQQIFHKYTLLPSLRPVWHLVEANFLSDCKHRHVTVTVILPTVHSFKCQRFPVIITFQPTTCTLHPAKYTCRVPFYSLYFCFLKYMSVNHQLIVLYS